MDIGGGRKDKKKDNDKWNKGKGKMQEKELDEEEMPRNKKFMDHVEWDWSKYKGIVSNVLEQGKFLICWAIAFIRAIEALFNIGQRLEDQRSFSIQHLINNVPLGKYGLEDCKTLEDFVLKHGILEEGECSYKRTKETCAHIDPKIEKIDRIAIINTVDDVELARLVRRHPVVGVLPLWGDLNAHRHGVYKPNSGHGNLEYHAVLIIGFGVDETGQYYWIVQNSWGRSWGVNGIGRIRREHQRGRRSLFTQIYYGEKTGFPKNKKK